MTNNSPFFTWTQAEFAQWIAESDERAHREIALKQYNSGDEVLAEWTEKEHHQYV